jgi:hypothetical protein
MESLMPVEKKVPEWCDFLARPRRGSMSSSRGTGTKFWQPLRRDCGWRACKTPAKKKHFLTTPWKQKAFFEAHVCILCPSQFTFLKTT